MYYCMIHADYDAKKRPATACPKCWTAYGKAHPKTTAGKFLKSLTEEGGNLYSRQVAALLMVLPDRMK